MGVSGKIHVEEELGDNSEAEGLERDATARLAKRHIEHIFEQAGVESNIELGPEFVSEDNPPAYFPPGDVQQADWAEDFNVYLMGGGEIRSVASHGEFKDVGLPVGYVTGGMWAVKAASKVKDSERFRPRLDDPHTVSTSWRWRADQETYGEGTRQTPQEDIDRTENFKLLDAQSHIQDEATVVTVRAEKTEEKGAIEPEEIEDTVVDAKNNGDIVEWGLTQERMKNEGEEKIRKPGQLAKFSFGFGKHENDKSTRYIADTNEEVGDPIDRLLEKYTYRSSARDNVSCIAPIDGDIFEDTYQRSDRLERRFNRYSATVLSAVGKNIGLEAYHSDSPSGQSRTVKNPVRRDTKFEVFSPMHIDGSDYDEDDKTGDIPAVTTYFTDPELEEVRRILS